MTRVIKSEQQKRYDRLIQGNKDWVSSQLAEDPDYFVNLSKGQNPETLWIGCSDSRVSANTVTNTKPGQIFVHRNIANVCVHSDMNMLSVLDYAVNTLNVKHIIVSGHYGCGGIIAALSNKEFGLIDNWLRHIKDVYRLHADELDQLSDETERANRLVELNVEQQVYNLYKTTIVQNALKKRSDLELHGWVIQLDTGFIKDLNISCDLSNIGLIF